MCNNKNNDNECRCLAEILMIINVLQRNAECSDSCLDSCDRGFLGCGNASSIGCNTRPVMLYTCCGNGVAWSMPVAKVDGNCGDVNIECSNVFRVEKVDGCCCTFRVLAPNPNTTAVALIPYIATNSFFTMDLGCVCCLRCLQDTFVECIN